MPSGDPAPATGTYSDDYPNDSQSQCCGSLTKGQLSSCQFPNCDQKYSFPNYYYAKLLEQVNKADVPESDLQKEAEAEATKICEGSEPQPFAHMDPKPKSGSCENVLTLKQVGQIFKAGAGKYAKYCMEAVIVAAGECGPCTPGTCRWPQLWGAGSSEEPDAEMKLVVKELDTCASQPEQVSEGMISAGNSNKIGPFCHMHKLADYKGKPRVGASWGGGMCSGGV